jgi:hypothetical protein
VLVKCILAQDPRSSSNFRFDLKVDMLVQDHWLRAPTLERLTVLACVG